MDKKIKKGRLGVRVPSHLISQHAPVGRHNMNFDREIEATNLSLQQLFLHLNAFQKPQWWLIPERSLEADRHTALLSKNKETTKIPQGLAKGIVLHCWILAHIVVEENDTADKVKIRKFRSSYKQKLLTSTLLKIILYTNIYHQKWSSKKGKGEKMAEDCRPLENQQRETNERTYCSS